MTPAARRRVALACVALGSYAACADQPAEPQHTPFADVPKAQRVAAPEIPQDWVAPPSQKPRPPRASRNAPRWRSSSVRGGPLPPDSVRYCESRGDYTAQNARSSASGGWQITDGSWGGYGGYAHAKDAPRDVQDARAAELWNGGRGASNWSQCL